jgi:hypothetical protein
MITIKIMGGSFLILTLLIAVGWSNRWHSTEKNHHYDGLQLIVNDLPEHGVLIHHSSNPEFQNELTAFYSIPPEILNDVMRFSIVVHNNTPHYIKSLTLIWKFYPSQGAPITNSSTSSYGNTFSNNPAQGLIKPNGKYARSLLMSGTVVAYAGPEPPKLEIKNDERYKRQLDNLNGKLARSVKWSVDIDGVLFSNGIFVGPDTLKTFDSLNARFKGEKDLIEELMQILNNNQPIADVFAHAQPLASITNAELEASYPDFRDRMRNPDYIYKRTKSNMARQVIERRNRLGEQASIDFIKQRSKEYIPLVKK